MAVYRPLFETKRLQIWSCVLLLILGVITTLALKRSTTGNKVNAIKSLSNVYEADCTAPQPQAMQSGCAVLPARGDAKGSIWNASKDFKSQSEEDRLFLERYFFGVRGGSFLEMGALDGLRFSNTYFFEKNLNWSGLLIEGAPRNYGKLRTTRPASIAVNAVVCDKPRMVHMIDKQAVGGVYEFMSEDFREKWHPNVELSELPEIPCLPLGALLERYGIRHVDLFSLDVEGAEAVVLSTLDFSKFSASVVLMEWGREPSYLEALSHLQGAGYILEEIRGHPRNRILVHPSFKEKLDKLPKRK